jgi:hypothetical protein
MSASSIPEGPMSHAARETAAPSTPPSLGALLLRAFDDDELAPTVTEQERYVRDDDDGYSG